MAVNIFATYSLKKGKSLGPKRSRPLWGLFLWPWRPASPRRQDPEGQDPDNNSSQVDPLGLDLAFTQSALGCYGFFYGLSSLQLG